MAVWPAIGVTPDLPITRTPRDNAIRNQMEAGYPSARPRFTRKVSTFGPLTYSTLLAAEKSAIEALHDEVGCSGSFAWTMPVEGTTHTVMFKEPPKFELIGPNIWKATCTLEEL
mgnify:CR=1 FL=1